MTIEQIFDSLQYANIESLYKKALKFELLEKYKEKVSSINATTISSQEKIKLQKELLIELECAKIDEVYKGNLKNGKFKKYEEKIKEIQTVTVVIRKAELQRELLIKEKLSKMEILLEDEFNRLTIINNTTRELVYTEEYYNSFLKRFLVDFIQKLLTEPLKDNFNVKNILIKLEMLYYMVELSDNILSKLRKAESLKNVDERTQIIAKILQTNLLEVESLYSKYVSIYYEIVELYKELREKNDNFSKFCETFAQLLMNDFIFYVTLPIQKIPKYTSFLKEMAKYSSFRTSDEQMKDAIIFALENISVVGAKLNEIKKSHTRAKLFLEADGMKIKIKNIKYQNIKQQQVYPGGPTIFQGSGYMVENNELDILPVIDEVIMENKKPLPDRPEINILDAYKRTILKIKYKYEDIREHMDIVCGKKELQQFADDNVRYKGTKVMDIFEESQKSNLTQMEELLKQLLKYEFPNCSFIIERIITDDEKFKIIVKDANDTNILHIEEQQGPIKYKVIMAEDPHKQFFNSVELYDLATKAASIVIKATKESVLIKDAKSLNKRTSPICKVGPGNYSATNNAEYMKELVDTLISYGVKGIQIKHYPKELSEREIYLHFEEIYILKNQNPNEDELQQIKILLDRYQGLLSAGYVPTIDVSDRELFSKYNNDHVRVYTIETNEPLLAIKQYEMLMQDNVKFTLILNSETKKAIINHLGNEGALRTIDMKPIGGSGDNIIKNKDHAGNLSKLQTAIQFGFIPVFKDDFLEKLHALSMRTLVTIATTYPTIAIEQWKVLISAGIPAKFDFSDGDIKKTDLKNQSNQVLVINATNAQNAIKTYKAALDAGFNPTFSEETRLLVLSAIAREPNINKITVANPTMEILKKVFKDGLLLDLYDALLMALIKDLKKRKVSFLIELVNVTNSNNILLLKMQINQVERINVDAGASKIKYKVNDTTKTILDEQLPQKVVEGLRYFYRDLSILEQVDAEDKTDVADEAIPKLTILDQLTHEKLISFASLYGRDYLLTIYKKNKRFFDSSKVSKRCLAHIDEIQRIINSRDDSPNPINKARIKPMNNPAQRIELMLTELKALQNTIKHENRWWFSSRLIPILNHIIADLVTIRTMHNNCSFFS